MKHSVATRFRAKLDAIIDEMDDDTALDNIELYQAWRIGTTYYGPNDQNHPQSRVPYNGKLHKCLQTHVSQIGYEPDVAVSLWYEIPDPAIEWPEWKQPIGAGTGYPLGAKTSHNGKHWINVGKDDNEYEPGVWGWDEVV